MTLRGRVQGLRRPLDRPQVEQAPHVAVLGDYAHFLQGMLAPALEAVGVAHGPDLRGETKVALVWNPWSRLAVADLLPRDLRVPVVNGRHFHCAKTNVARHFEQVFGYALQVDPFAFAGAMVRKADENAAHDGVTLDGPLTDPADVRTGQVFQRLVDNTFGPSVVDVRVSVVRTVQAGCYMKLRPISDRYSNVNSAAWFAPTGVLLRPDEIELANTFADSIGLDFGQLDICRDNASGRIYVVDANNTPWGPANGMSEPDKRAALVALGRDFVREFLPVAA